MAIHYRRILELHSQKHSQRSIAASTGNSRAKIGDTIHRAEAMGIRPPFDSTVSDDDLARRLFPELRPEAKGREAPNYEYLHKELAKPNVTLTLLYYEYEASCRQSGTVPYSYRTFCRNYTEYAQKFKATMRIRRKPGEIMEVDWAGSTLKLTDRDTGEFVKAYLFLATLPSSQYSYCEACLTMKTEDWIRAHVHAYEFFGGVTEVLVPDNLKVDVTKHKDYEVILNPVYRDLAEHYGTVIVPARVKAPRDKASIEGTVNVLSTWVIAALRHEQFFTLEELNKAVELKLAEFNRRPFTKKYKAGNREEGFKQEEQFALRPLPQSPFQMAAWRTATVQPDYHILVEGMFYSVPFQYISSRVDIRLTSDLVEIFFKDSRLASHQRRYGHPGQFATLSEHMPESHQLYLSHTPETSREWAKKVGSATVQVVEYLLTSSRAERQALNATLRLKKLAQKYSLSDIEQACTDVMRVAKAPTVRVIERMLINQKKKQKSQPQQEQNDFGFTRGADYFGRTPHESRND